MDESTDRELLSAFAHGDESAFSAFYARHARAVHARLARVVPDEPDVEELMQEVFLLAARKWRSIDYVDGSARGWLFGVCFRVVASHRRAARRRPVEAQMSTIDSTILDMDGDPGAELRPEVLTVEDAVARMDPVDQRIYRHAFVDEKTHVQTARDLGLPAATVRKRFERLRRQLQRVLRGDDG